MTTYPRRSVFQVGGVTYPLTTTSGNDLLVDADPLIYNYLQFCKSIIRTYCGARFAQDATKANLIDVNGTLITSPVMQVVPYSPADYLQEVQFKFPLLSLDRISETYADKTAQWYEVSCKMQMLYILPPLTAAQQYQLSYFRKNVRDILLDRIQLGYDPHYNNNELVFKTAGIDQISMVKGDYIPIETVLKSGVKTFFPTLMITFDVKERKNQILHSFPDLTGIDGYVQISDGYQPNNYDMIDFALPLP